MTPCVYCCMPLEESGSPSSPSFQLSVYPQLHAVWLFGSYLLEHKNHHPVFASHESGAVELLCRDFLASPGIQTSQTANNEPGGARRLKRAPVAVYQRF